MMKEEFVPVENEVDTSSLEALGEELKAIRHAYAILFTQLSPQIKNGIIYQLNGLSTDAAKRMGRYLSQFTKFEKS
ncbi:hypothetical protein HPS27_10355 [Klebsiella aerogenes]|uniref:hypothetical protein n=1 Tax=Klebsiella aerogenes TaxID=548 RepID=UPI0014951AC4|nr:hypothetical protein [Klebsiella aerogenes]NPD50429.1 hypothetical protein [Klebsiella aerogenes]HBU9918667.1 hypothetical protein [Klebsiella aerogenes]HCD9612698.1 hypothetical protein [Klebsiella aerogenes]